MDSAHRRLRSISLHLLQRESISSHGMKSVTKDNANFGGNNGSEELGHASSRKRQNKGSNKLHPSHKQRSSPDSFRFYGNGRNLNGIVSESPPSSSVGYFFGSTPPENSGFCSFMQSNLSGSPHGSLALRSSPVGSMQKSFPQFPHPSHQLLEENGFRYQKYLKYHKRCLNDRKKLGIGCSECKGSDEDDDDEQDEYDKDDEEDG